MIWQSIVSIVGLLLALASLAGIAYGFGYKWGQVKAELRNLAEANLAGRLIKVETKQDVLWEGFTDDVLHRRPSLGSSSSPFQLSQLARQALDEVKLALKPHCKGEGNEVSCLNTPEAVNLADQVLVELPKHVGLERLRTIAQTHEISLAELLAIVTNELSQNSHKP